MRHTILLAPDLSNATNQIDFGLLSFNLECIYMEKSDFSRLPLLTQACTGVTIYFKHTSVHLKMVERNMIGTLSKKIMWSYDKFCKNVMLETLIKYIIRILASLSYSFQSKMSKNRCVVATTNIYKTGLTEKIKTSKLFKIYYNGKRGPQIYHTCAFYFGRNS